MALFYHRLVSMYSSTCIQVHVFKYSLTLCVLSVLERLTLDAYIMSLLGKGSATLV